MVEYECSLYSPKASLRTRAIDSKPNETKECMFPYLLDNQHEYSSTNPDHRVAQITLGW